MRPIYREMGILPAKLQQPLQVDPLSAHRG